MLHDGDGWAAGWGLSRGDGEPCQLPRDEYCPRCCRGCIAARAAAAQPATLAAATLATTALAPPGSATCFASSRG